MNKLLIPTILACLAFFAGGYGYGYVKGKAQGETEMSDYLTKSLRVTGNVCLWADNMKKDYGCDSDSQ